MSKQPPAPSRKETIADLRAEVARLKHFEHAAFELALSSGRRAAKPSDPGELSTFIDCVVAIRRVFIAHGSDDHRAALKVTK